MCEHEHVGGRINIRFLSLSLSLPVPSFQGTNGRQTSSVCVFNIIELVIFDSTRETTLVVCILDCIMTNTVLGILLLLLVTDQVSVYFGLPFDYLHMLDSIIKCSRKSFGFVQRVNVD